jgi:hypothetical protein
MHCHELVEKLHGPTSSMRAGMGSVSATGFAPASSSQYRRCFSLSSLRDSNFWEQRFQELSQLIGNDEAERAEAGSATAQASCGAFAHRRHAGTVATGSNPSSILGGVGQVRFGAPVVVSGQQTLMQSTSLSALQPREDEIPHGRSTARDKLDSGGFDAGQKVRRVASAPLLPSPPRLQASATSDDSPATAAAPHAVVPKLQALSQNAPQHTGLTASNRLDLSDLRKKQLEVAAILSRQRVASPIPPGGMPSPQNAGGILPAYPLKSGASTERLPVARQVSATFSGQDFLHYGDGTGRSRGSPGPPSASVPSGEIGRAGPPSVLPTSSPRIATARGLAGSTGVMAASPTPAPATPSAVLSGAARPLVTPSVRSTSQGLPTAPRSLLGTASTSTAASRGQLAYPAAGAALPHRPGP